MARATGRAGTSAGRAGTSAGRAGNSAGRAGASAERDQWRELPDERRPASPSGTSGDQPARAERAETSQPELNQRRSAGRVRPVARAAGRARSQRFRATSASRSESVIRGGARGASARGESQTLGGARYERREGVRGRPNAAGRLAQKLPSPALKEAERSGSYNPGDLNTLTGGTVRNGTVQGHIAGGAGYAVPCESTRT